MPMTHRERFAKNDSTLDRLSLLLAKKPAIGAVFYIEVSRLARNGRDQSRLTLRSTLKNSPSTRIRLVTGLSADRGDFFHMNRARLQRIFC